MGFICRILLRWVQLVRITYDWYRMYYIFLLQGGVMMAISHNEDVNCLAINQLKARITKDTIIKDRLSNKDTSIANKVIKYKTLLSEKMLKFIKTQELEQFKLEMQEYCTQEYQKYEKTKIQNEHNSIRKSSIRDVINQVKQMKKNEIMSRKYRTEGSMIKKKTLMVVPSRVHRSESNIVKREEEQIPLDNSKIKEAIAKDHNKQQKTKLSQSGKIIICYYPKLQQKIKEIEMKSTTLKRKDGSHREDQEQQILEPCKSLKKQSERLISSMQIHKSFKPLGKIKRQLLSQNEKAHNFSYQKPQGAIGNGKYFNTNMNKYRNLKKQNPSIVQTNKLSGRSQIKLQEGLPKSIRDIIPIKRYKENNQNLHILYKDEIQSQIISQNKVPRDEIIQLFILEQR